MLIKQILSGLICLCITTGLLGQSEMIVEDMDNDDQVVIEMEAETTANTNYRNLQTGIKNNEGFLKTVSDNDLSFWTNSNRKITIENNGNIGIGNTNTNPQDLLHVRSGRFRIQANSTKIGNLILPANFEFDFNGNTRVGGIRYQPTSFSFPFTPGGIILSNNLEGVINFKTDNTDRLIINEEGEVRIPEIAQGTPANVFVDNSGRIRTRLVDKVINITPHKLRYNYSPEELTPHLVRGKSNIFNDLFASIDVPHGSIITNATIFYVDNSSTRDLQIKLVKGNHNAGNASNYTSTTIFDSSGSPSSSATDILTETKSLNYTVVNNSTQRTNLAVSLPSSNLGISAIVLEYEN